MIILRIILAITVITLSCYGFITGDVGTIVPYMLLSCGLLFIVMGITEFKKRKADAFYYFILSAFVLYIAIYIL
ncbi:DUF3953 domain-containing protein [Sporosarcina luteola]|uniref:DUF3953 domain-containing protein n=1 Tax=Sporosarcina luteola TaxID=582850 RepID=UPI00203EC2DE|nr:DUF3953 domain-containing protein [Sporosarcina luteola]